MYVKSCIRHTAPTNFEGNLKYCQAGTDLAISETVPMDAGCCFCLFVFFFFFFFFLYVIFVVVCFLGGWSVVRNKGVGLERVCQFLHTTHSTH